LLADAETGGPRLASCRCAFGFSVVPTTLLGRLFPGSYSTAFFAGQAYVLANVSSSYLSWLATKLRSQRVASLPWALPPHYDLGVSTTTWCIFGAWFCCTLLSGWLIKLAMIDNLVIFIAQLDYSLPGTEVLQMIAGLQSPSSLALSHLLAQHLHRLHTHTSRKAARFWILRGGESTIHRGRLGGLRWTVDSSVDW
jgi:hypothetical protein